MQSILKTVKYPAEELAKIIKCMVIFSNSNPDVINILSLLGLTGLDSGDKRKIFLFLIMIILFFCMYLIESNSVFHSTCFDCIQKS